MEGKMGLAGWLGRMVTRKYPSCFNDTKMSSLPCLLPASSASTWTIWKVDLEWWAGATEMCMKVNGHMIRDMETLCTSTQTEESTEVRTQPMRETEQVFSLGRLEKSLKALGASVADAAKVFWNCQTAVSLNRSGMSPQTWTSMSTSKRVLFTHNSCFFCAVNDFVGTTWHWRLTHFLL